MLTPPFSPESFVALNNDSVAQSMWSHKAKMWKPKSRVEALSHIAKKMHKKDADFCHCIQCFKYSKTHFRNSKIVLVKILEIQKDIFTCDISTLRPICRCEKSSHFLMLSTKKSHYVHPQQFQKSLFQNCTNSNFGHVWAKLRF